MVDPITTVSSAVPPGTGAAGVAANLSTPLPAAVPAAGTASPAPASAPPGDSLQSAVQKVREQYAGTNSNVDVTFSIDAEQKLVVVKIVDSTDGTVLRQIPSEEMLRLAQAMSTPQGGLLHETT